MAFSKDQKTQLSLMIEKPAEFLNNCKEGKVYLPGFRNEYFKDGAGIYHLLAEAFINDKDNPAYKELFDYLLEQDHKISIFDYSGRKESAFSVLIKGINESPKNPNLITDENGTQVYAPPLATFVTDILIKEKNVKTDEKYHIRSYINLLADNGYTNEIDKVLSRFKDIVKDEHTMQLLLKSAIDFSKSPLLDYFLNSKDFAPILDEQIPTYEFNTAKPHHERRKGNIYTYCITSGNDTALFKLIDKFGNKVPFNGDIVRPKVSYHYATLDESKPLDLILKNNKAIFDKYYSAMDLESRVKWLAGEASYYGKLHDVYAASLENVVLKDFDNIFSSTDVKIRDKLSLYNQILSFNKNAIEPEKFQTIEKILDPLWDKIPPFGEATSFKGARFFFNNFYSKGDMSDAEINAFINIFTKMKEREDIEACERIFSNSFFNEPKLVTKLIDAGLNLDFLPREVLMEGRQDLSINVYDHYLSLVENKRKTNQQKIDELDEEKASQTLQVIYNHNPELVFKKTSKNVYILNRAIELNNKEIFELLTVEDFKKFKELAGDTVLESIKKSYSPTQEYRETFDILLEKLFKADFFQKINTEEETPEIFYTFFDKTSNYKLLDDVLTHVGFDFNKEINKVSFWRSLNTEHSVEYIESKVTAEIDEKNAKSIMASLSYFDSSELQLLNILDVFPNLYKTKLSDGDNILHNAIKHDSYRLANLIVDRYPELAVEANKQNKMPISYLIVSFAKTIDKNSSKVSSYHHEKKHEKLFNNLINCGLVSQNKKANAFLDEQLEKYTSIKEAFPEAIRVYEYKKMDKVLRDNNTPSTKKLKI